MGYCKHCGSSDGCKPVGGTLNMLAQSKVVAFTADDWAKVYWFLKYIQLPFIHRLIVEAMERAEKQEAV